VQQLAAKFGIEERTLRGRLARKREGESAVAAGPIDVARPPAPPNPTMEKAARELLACAFADKATAALVRAEFPAERYPSELLRLIAATAYRLFDQNGEISTSDLVALLQDAAAMELAAAIGDLEIDPATAALRAAGSLKSLGLGEARSEYQGKRGRLNDTSEDAQREELKKFLETKKAKARDNPRAMPGR
jgi:hypothetical protein